MPTRSISALLLAAAVPLVLALGPVTPAAEPTASVAVQADVLGSTMLPDGRIENHIWLPAPGHTTENLVQWAKAQGFTDARAIEAPRVALTSHRSDTQLPPCSYGHARSLACPTVRWRASGRHNPFVWFEDHLDRHEFGVPLQQSAVPNWHFAQVGIDIGYVYNDCSTRWQPGHKCIDFNDDHYGNTPWMGNVVWFRDVNEPRFFAENFDGIATEVDVAFNIDKLGPGFNPTRSVMRAAGRAIGLGNSTIQNSVMWPDVTPGVGLIWPTQDEASMVNSLYIFGDV